MSELNSSTQDKELMIALTDNFEYRDPTGLIRGATQLAEYMEAFQKEYSGTYFTIIFFHQHNDRSMANWNLGIPDIIDKSFNPGATIHDGQEITLVTFKHKSQIGEFEI